MKDLFSTLGGDFVEPPIVIDAALPLELSGEAVRGRICVFTDEDGREWALRPDLTLPVAVDEIARRRDGAEGERVVRYHAPVFRLPAIAGEPVEFLQAGFERFGGVSDAASDAEMFAAIADACARAGLNKGVVKLGDLGIFPAFVDALDLAPETAAGLKRAFRQEGGVRAFLKAERGGAASDLSQRLKGMSPGEVRGFVDDVFTLTGVRPVGERSAEEIVERLYQRAQAGDGHDVDTQSQSVLEAVLDVETGAAGAADALRDLARANDLSGVDEVIDRLAQRTELMISANSALLQNARFSTRYGRRFTYYDGFVFEMCGSESDSEAGRPFAAGGRYDHLLADLSGGTVAACAVGGVVVPHRLNKAREAQS